MDLSSLEGISKALEKSLDFWGLMLLLATALVVIGLVVEYWHDVQEFWVRLTWPMASFPWDKFTALVGGILVTIGVAGELIVTYEASRVETKLRENSHKIETLLTQEAGDAAASAKTAHDEADAVRTEADAISVRLEAASIKLGDVERETLTQGPRWRLLNKVAPELAKHLSRFAGQRVELFVCGRRGSQDGEMLQTWGAIANILDSDVVAGVAGAKWKEVPTNLVYFDRGCSPGGGQPLGQGIAFMVSKSASRTTMEAAKALSAGVNKVLPPSSINALSVVDPDFSKKYLQPIEGKDTPWALAANDPDLITVLIGAHPQQ